MYQINQLSFSYETKEVLKNISVTFPTNKITAIIGPNGCGKSTLLSHLYRLHPSKNKITLNEKPLESYKGREFAQLVAVLTQSRDAMIDDFLVKDITRHMKRVESCANREIPERMLVAFTSFDFNTGGWCGSRSNREFNAGNLKEACRAMAYAPSGKPAWSYINGSTFVPGLFSRRIRESGVCYEGAS